MDIFLLASGSIRTEALGPIVTKGDFTVCFPYDDPVHLVYWTGAQLKHALMRMLRDEALAGAHTEFYQLSKGLEVEYDQKSHTFLKFNYEGEPVDDDRVFTVGLQLYHYVNMKDSFDLDLDEIHKEHRPRIISSSCCQVIEEILIDGQHQNADGTGRLIIHLADGTTTGLPLES